MIIFQRELYIVGGFKLNQNKNDSDLSTFKESNKIFKYKTKENEWIELSKSFKQNNSLKIQTGISLKKRSEHFLSLYFLTYVYPFKMIHFT